MTARAGTRDDFDELFFFGRMLLYAILPDQGFAFSFLFFPTFLFSLSHWKLIRDKDKSVASYLRL